MLEVVIDVSFFLKIVECFREVVRECYLKFSKKGMTIQCMDPAHVAFVHLFLDKDGFDTYKCPKATQVGIDIEFFGSILRLSKSPLDKLTMKFDDSPKGNTQSEKEQTQSGGSNFINLEIKDISTERVTEFTMKLVNFEDKGFKLPKLKSDSLLCMRSSDFSAI